MPDVASIRRFLLDRTYSFAILLVTVLFVGNLIENPEFVASDQIAGTLAIAAPFVIAAVASTPRSSPAAAASTSRSARCSGSSTSSS